MKELRNSFDSEARFGDLDKAKSYYMPKDEIACQLDDFLGNESEYKDFCEKFNEYKDGIAEADSLEELSSVLNRYSDIFDNGSEYKVVEF